MPNRATRPTDHPTNRAHDCPVCGSRVYRTHRCRGRAADLTTMPPDFRDLLAQLLAEQDPPPPTLPLDQEEDPQP